MVNLKYLIGYYLLNKIIGKDAREKLKELEVIEVFALAYMRGMNIDNSILIFVFPNNDIPYGNFYK